MDTLNIHNGGHRTSFRNSNNGESNSMLLYVTGLAEDE